MRAIAISYFSVSLKFDFFRENFIFFVLMAGEKCCKLVLHVDKTIILNLAMMTIMMHVHLNTAILFLLLDFLIL